MELLTSTFTPAFFSALLAIILIDLALAGDNAIVIGLAARQVPQHLQKKVLLWGAVAAVVVRAICTLFVVWLLKIPGFLLAGGLTLIYIAWKLVQPQNDPANGNAHSMTADVSLRQAIQTIVIADMAMGIENVLAIGGAAHGSMLLVVLGSLVASCCLLPLWALQLALSSSCHPSHRGIIFWTERVIFLQ